MTLHRQLYSCAFAFLLLFFSGISKSAPQELVFLTWSEYMDPELVTEFEAEFNAKVRFVYFESDETRNDILIQADGKGYDLILVNYYALPTYLQQGWIAELNQQRIPNLRHIDLRWKQHSTEFTKYAVPYFWGTMGIAYRADLVSEPITRWMQLLTPEKSMQGKIVMIKNMSDVLGAALMALGHSVNSTDPGALAAAEVLLQQQKPFVRDYSYVMLNKESSLVSGETVASMIYSGDALMVAEHHPEITYVVPEEGGALWIDYLAIASGSDRKDLAADFINFMNEPQRAARQAEYVYYATPNKAAEAFLSAEYLQDPVINPDQETLQRCEFYTQQSPRLLRERNRIFNSLLQ